MSLKPSVEWRGRDVEITDWSIDEGEPTTRHYPGSPAIGYVMTAHFIEHEGGRELTTEEIESLEEELGHETSRRILTYVFEQDEAAREDYTEYE